jgi:hypothetical protein
VAALVAPIPADIGAALAAAVRRTQRLVDDPAGAVWYGVRRILAFALMIRSGIPAAEIESYLHARMWLTDAARLLGSTPEALAAELVDTMLSSGGVGLRDNRPHAAAEHTPVAADSIVYVRPMGMFEVVRLTSNVDRPRVVRRALRPAFPGRFATLRGEIVTTSG